MRARKGSEPRFVRDRPGRLGQGRHGGALEPAAEGNLVTLTLPRRASRPILVHDVALNRAH